MTAKTPPPPRHTRRFDRGWLMRHSAAWADEARVLLAVPLRPPTLRMQPVPVQVGRRSIRRRLTSI